VVLGLVVAGVWCAAGPTALAQTISGTFAGPILSGSTATLVNGASIVGDVTNAGLLEFSLSGSSLTVLDPYVISGTGQVLLNSTSSTITFANSNTYSGLTTLNGGVLALDNVNALAGGGAVTFGGGTLRYSASNVTDLSSRIASSGSAISIDTADQAVTFASGLAATNTGGLTKLGAGSLTLSGTSTYTGATQVSVGSLYVDGQLGNTAVAVNAGTLLGGKGTILGPVTISSGTLAPGSLSTPLANLTVGDLVMSGSTTTTVMTISGSSVGQYDQVAAANVGTTSLTLAGILDLTMTGTAAGGSYDYANLTTFHLFSGFAPVSGNFSQIVLNAAGTRYDGLLFAFNSDGVWRTPWTSQSVGQYLVFDATTGELLVVPEPGTLVLAGMAIACLTAAARWRRAAGRAAGKPGGTLVQVTSPAQQTAV
jgi:autotransporter-associated beta strand protein